MPKIAVTKERHSTISPPSGGHAPLYLQLTNLYAPAWGYGGPVRLLFDYARWLCQEFQVMVFSGDVHHDFTRIPVKSETIQGVPIRRHRLFFRRLAKKSVYLLSPLMCVGAARQIRSTHGPVLVHFSELRGLVPLYGLLLKLLFGKRVKLVHSAFGSLYYKRGWRRKIYDALFMKTFVRQVDLRLVQNGHERDAYGEICRDYGQENESKIVLLPLHVDGVPADPARFTKSGKNQTAVRAVRRTYGVPEDALVFLFLGRLHSAKGILRMIDAYLKFCRSCPRNTLLLIVGRDDGFQAKVEECIAGNRAHEKIRIVNNVYENRFDYYFLADVFLGFPTIFEETMLASVEAMACGTPILVSQEAGIPFVEEEQAGLVIEFDVRTAAAAMAAITQALASFQVNARRVVARHFTGDIISRRFSDLLRTAVSGGHSSEELGEPEQNEAIWADEESCVKSSSSMASGSNP
jgi:glycosyltransferase involved in cell wall biosynthesis